MKENLTRQSSGTCFFPAVRRQPLLLLVLCVISGLISSSEAFPSLKKEPVIKSIIEDPTSTSTPNIINLLHSSSPMTSSDDKRNTLSSEPGNDLSKGHQSISQIRVKRRGGGRASGGRAGGASKGIGNRGMSSHVGRSRPGYNTISPGTSRLFINNHEYLILLMAAAILCFSHIFIVSCIHLS